MAVVPGVVILGLSSNPASAAPASSTGYLPFGPQAFGDAQNCQTISPNSDFVDSLVDAPVVGMTVSPGCDNAWVATADGGVFSSPGAPFYGSAGNLHLNQPIVGVAGTPDGGGYWLVAADGGIFSFGDAHFYGSTGGLHLNQPIVGMAATPDGGGYWLVAADGGVFSFGDASFYGSMGGELLKAPVVGIASTHDGGGYWLVAADGGVFSFGDAHFYGSEGGVHLLAPVAGVATTPDGLGYWLVGADGGVFTFGDAGFFGSLAELAGGPGGSEGGTVIANPVIGITSSPSGQGYFLLPTTPAINPSNPNDTGYALAKREWEIVGSVIAAEEGEVLSQASAYLSMGEGVDPGDTVGYPAVVQALNQLGSIPETDVSPAQDAEAEADIAAISAFFGTPT
jgi:hypothetical protein